MNTTKDTVSINGEYKDRVFCLLFGREEYKDNILSLYNALNNTNYDNVDDIEITTIEDTIFIRMKNDVSFLVGSYLSLWEQQSTFNPNMPIRGLMYYGNLYNSYIHNRGINIYGSTLVKLPAPNYIVFYNGNANREAIEKLKLSDAFVKNDASNEFEWTATMINLNQGKNEELLAKCKVLSDYMVLINKIRKYQKEMDNMRAAVDCAVNECITEGVLAEFLKKHRGDVMASVLTEFNEEVYRKGMREEGIVIFIETLYEFGTSESVIEQKLMEKYRMSKVDATRYLTDYLQKQIPYEVVPNVLTEFNEEVFVRSMKEEGREEGREEAKFEIAINLLDVLSDEEIAKRIGLPLETVQQLRKENQNV